MKTILVTGGAGYLGSLLVPELLLKGYRVIVLDALYFGPRSLSAFLSQKNFTLVTGDILEINKYRHLVEAADAVIHLAALSNDPTCEIDSQLAKDINHKSTVELADLCKKTGIKRFLFASSCSIYGWRGSEILTEDEESNPVSVYAHTKVYSEKHLLKIAGQGFEPIILRMATLYGQSPRMRFDLAVNVMTLNAIRDNSIQISGGGIQWRPFVHIKDAVGAFIHLLEYPVKDNDKIFNIGSNEQNHAIFELANIVRKDLPATELIYLKDDMDKRSYRVSFDKIKSTGYKLKGSIGMGVNEVAQFVRKNSTNFNNPVFYNIRTMKNMLKQRPKQRESSKVVILRP